MANTSFISFSKSPFFDTFFSNIAPNKMRNQRKNKLSRIISSCLEDYNEATLHSFYHKQHFTSNTGWDLSWKNNVRYQKKLKEK